MRIALAAATIAAMTAAVPAADAATPSQGEVGNAQLTQSWSGEAYGQPMKLGSDVQTHQLCINPFCDSFTLTVRDPGALRVTLTAPGSAAYVDVLVTEPDGTETFITGDDTAVSQELTYKTAALGAYTFDIWPNEIYGLYNGQYSGDATLCPASVPFDECFPAPDEE
jgi:hypothetical protein